MSNSLLWTLRRCREEHPASKLWAPVSCPDPIPKQWIVGSLKGKKILFLTLVFKKQVLIIYMVSLNKLIKCTVIGGEAKEYQNCRIWKENINISLICRYYLYELSWVLSSTKEILLSCWIIRWWVEILLNCLIALECITQWNTYGPLYFWFLK